MRFSVLLAGAFLCIAGPASANVIERACLSSGREAANRNLCACIGRVADQTLSRNQMREAARFFGDPQLSQNVRMSSRPRDEALWTAYRNFGDLAAATCD